MRNGITENVFKFLEGKREKYFHREKSIFFNNRENKRVGGKKKKKGKTYFIGKKIFYLLKVF